MTGGGRGSGRHRHAPAIDPPTTETSFETRLQEFAERMGTIRQTITPVPPPEPDAEPDAEPTPPEWSPPILSVRSAPPTNGAIAVSAQSAALVACTERLRSTFSRAARRVARRSDGEAIHDLRVSARRLVALLDVWRDLFRPGMRRKTTRALRDLRRELGEAREIEVHTALLDGYAQRTLDATRDLLDLAVHQGRRRLDPARRRAARCAGAAKTRALIDRLEKAARRMPDRAQRKPGALESARAQVLRRQQNAMKAIEVAAGGSDDGAFHRARIEVKKWRYACEVLEAGQVSVDEQRQESIRDLQEILGIIQDRASLRRELLPEEAFVEPPESLVPMLDEIGAERRAAIDRFRTSAAHLIRGATAKLEPA